MTLFVGATRIYARGTFNGWRLRICMQILGEFYLALKGA